MNRRSKPLERTQLRVTAEQVRAWESKPRKPIPKIGAKTRRERAELDAARIVVKGRTWCQAQAMFDERGNPICGTMVIHEGSDPHHVWPEDRDCGVHDPERMLLLCRRSHNWVDNHPTEAQALGILRPRPLGE